MSSPTEGPLTIDAREVQPDAQAQSTPESQPTATDAALGAQQQLAAVRIQSLQRRLLALRTVAARQAGSLLSEGEPDVTKF